jgi:hypothetical protein
MLDIDADNILLVSTKPAIGTDGIILHLREIEGKPAEFRIFSPLYHGKKGRIVEVNVLGEGIGPPLDTIEMNPWESRFFLVEF